MTLADSLIQRPNYRVAAGLAISMALGFLAHLSFLFVFVGVVGWILFGLFRSRSAERAGWGPCLAALLPPMVVVLWLYITNVSDMQIGGGDPAGVLPVLISLFSITMGGPTEGWLSVFAAAAFLVVAVPAIRSTVRLNPGLAVFTLTMVVATAGYLIVRPVAFLYPRYFLVWLPPLLWMIAAWLGSMMQDTKRRWFAVTLLVAMITFNGYQIADLIRVGRGGYTEAVTMMRSYSKNHAITMGSDHDFRNGMVLGYTINRMAPAGGETYLSADQWPPEGPDWIFVHSQETDYVADRLLAVSPTLRYELMETFPYAGLSGWHWSLYRRVSSKVGG